MKHNDQQLGKPGILYKDTRANIEDLADVPEGAKAFATDKYVEGVFANGAWVWDREVLQDTRTYYVALTGDDGNDGLTSETPFLTVQKAVNVITSELDVNLQQVYIQLADGEYEDFYAILRNAVNVDPTKPITIKGNASNPENVICEDWYESFCFKADGATGMKTVWRVQDLTVRNSTSNSGSFHASNGGHIQIQNVIFDVGGYGLYVADNSFIEFTGNCQIKDQVSGFIFMADGVISLRAKTFTILENLSSSVAFVSMAGGRLKATGATFSMGAYSATGKRFEMSGGVIESSSLTQFPGDTDGTIGLNCFYGSLLSEVGYADEAGDADTVDGSHASDFAPAAKGVTNGDSHDHSGGDGAQIDHEGLSGLLGGASSDHYHLTTLEYDKIFQYRNAFDTQTDHFESGANQNGLGSGWGSWASNCGFTTPGSINHLNYKSLYYIAFTAGHSANPKCFLPRSTAPSSLAQTWGAMKCVLRNMPANGYIGVRIDNNQEGASENAVEILLRQGSGVVDIVGRLTAAGSVSTYVRKTINFSPAFIGLMISSGGTWYSNWYINSYMFIDTPAVEGLGFAPGGFTWQPARIGITMYVASASPAWYYGAFVDAWRSSI